MRLAFSPIVLTLLLSTTLTVGADGDTNEPTVRQLLERARDAYRAGDVKAALKLATTAASAEPENPVPLLVRSQLHQATGRLKDALADMDRVVALEPDRADWRNERGALRFFTANIEGSLQDFDKAIELAPGSAPHHWQRGISLYYAGRFKAGAAQFETHRDVNPHDVENAAWHFICKARAESPKAASDNLIPIDTARDTRVPMKQVFALFGGTGTERAVLDAAEAEPSSPRTLRNHRMYAHLYLGLWHEAHGRTDKARRHMKLAAVEHRMDHYMGRVAQVHWTLMQKRDASSESDSSEPADDE